MGSNKQIKFSELKPHQCFSIGEPKPGDPIYRKLAHSYQEAERGEPRNTMSLRRGWLYEIEPDQLVRPVADPFEPKES